MSLSNLIQEAPTSKEHHLIVHKGGKEESTPNLQTTPYILHLDPIPYFNPNRESEKRRKKEFVGKKVFNLYSALRKYTPGVIIDNSKLFELLNKAYDTIQFQQRLFEKGKGNQYRINFLLIKDEHSPAAYFEVQEDLGGGIWETACPTPTYFQKISKD